MGNVRRSKNNYNLKWIPILAVLAIMAGCASPAKKACLQTDWKRIGYTDGSQGKLAADSASQRDACIREGVSPDMAQYELGRRQGLEKYCMADNGLALGTKGNPYQQVCPPELQASFKDAYQKGLGAYARQLEVDIQAKSDLQIKMRKELAGVEEDIAYLEQEIEAANDGQARLRMGMISEMRMLDRDEQSLSLQISSLEMDLKEMRQDLSRVRSQLGASDQ